MEKKGEMWEDLYYLNPSLTVHCLSALKCDSGVNIDVLLVEIRKCKN